MTDDDDDGWTGAGGDACGERAGRQTSSVVREQATSQTDRQTSNKFRQRTNDRRQIKLLIADLAVLQWLFSEEGGRKRRGDGEIVPGGGEQLQVGEAHDRE